jgi:hypothetical protein
MTMTSTLRRLVLWLDRSPLAVPAGITIMLVGVVVPAIVETLRGKEASGTSDASGEGRLPTRRGWAPRPSVYRDVAPRSC